MKLEDWQRRAVNEKRELDEKKAVLLAFFDTRAYRALPTEDRILLIAQHTHMKAYSDVLGTRIARFSLVPAIKELT